MLLAIFSAVLFGMLAGLTIFTTGCVERGAVHDRGDMVVNGFYATVFTVGAAVCSYSLVREHGWAGVLLSFVLWALLFIVFGCASAL